MKKHQSCYYLYVNDEAVTHVKAWIYTKFNTHVELQPTEWPLISIADLSGLMKSSGWRQGISFQEIADTLSSFCELAVIVNNGHKSSSYVGVKSTWKRTSELFKRIENV